jgi:cobalt-zinc-cadmium efflux system membrane fusion protein
LIGNTARAITVALVSIGAVGLAACRGASGSTEASTAPAADAGPKAAGSNVHLETAQLAQVHVEELAAHPSADTIKATGTVEFNADRMARILPPVAGQVQQLAVNIGDVVHKDDILFVLSSREVAAAIADHLASHKDLDLAEKTNAMTRDLFDHQAASRMALQQSESELAKARSKVLQTEEILQVLGLDAHPPEDLTRLQSRIPLRSPISGTVIERSVTNGQFVGPDNPPLMTIADLSAVWVQADIFERDLSHITVGQKADVTTAAYPDDRFTAQVSHIGAVVDGQTRTAKVRFLAANPNARLKPGMFASTTLYLPESPSALTVPARAIFVEGGRNFAYVQVGSQDFARRAVETAASGTDRLRILSGLQSGDRFVSDGVLLLRQLDTAGSQ